MMNFNPWIFAPIFFCVALPLLFGLILQLIARLGGWGTLARSYGSTEPMLQPRLRMQSIELRRWCGYGGCVTMAADAEALYMRPMWPFGFGHPLLRLPWAEAEMKATTSLVVIKITVFTFARAPGVPIAIRRSTAERLIEMARVARGASRL
jgi:hypothetical protein